MIESRIAGSTRWPIPLVLYDMPTIDGRVIEDGALTWGSPLPVFDGRFSTSPATRLGAIWDIEEHNEAVYAWIDFEPPIGTTLTADLDIVTVKVERDDGTFTITEASLLGAHASPLTAWPWLVGSKM